MGPERGTIFDDRQRDAVRVAAENVRGVKSISAGSVESTSGTVIEPREAGWQPKTDRPTLASRHSRCSNRNDATNVRLRLQAAAALEE
jgi:hypothetical protein